MARAARWRFGDVRPGEGPTIRLIAAVFAALEVGRGLGEVGVNALVLSRLPADTLPWLYIPLGLVSLVATTVIGAALGRYRRGRVIPAVLLAIGAILVAESVLLGAFDSLVPLAWLTVMAAGALAVTMAWTVAGSSLDARQAKRLFPLCTAAAIAGSFAGSLAAGPLAGWLGTGTLVGVEGLAFGVAAWSVSRVARRGPGAGWAPPVAGQRTVVADLRTGFDEVRQSPLLRLVAASYVLFAVLLFSVTYPYLVAARTEFPDEQRLAEVLGIVAAAVTAGSFLVSLLVADRFYRRLGIAAAALLLPVLYLAGFAVWLVSFTFVTATVVTVVQQIAQRGLSNAAWSAFYNVLPASRRAQALAFNDGVPGQLGIVLSGVLLLVAARYLAPTQIFWMGLLAAAACTGMVLAIRRRYAGALLRTLRAAPGERILAGGSELDAVLATTDAQHAALGALRAPDAPTRELAVALLSAQTIDEHRATLAVLLDDADPAVRAAAAARLLSRPPGPATEPAESALDALLHGPQAATIAGLNAMDRLGRAIGEDEGHLLGDADPQVRAAATTLLRHDSSSAATHHALAALDDPATGVRVAAATVLTTRPEIDSILAQRLRSAETVTITDLLAAQGRGADTRAVVADWAASRVRRARELAASRADVTVPDPDEDREFLLAVLTDRLETARDGALLAMRALGAPDAADVVRRGVRASDPDVRAQALEALESIGDRRLGTSIAGLLEAAPRGRNPADALGRLRHDVDPWVAAAARRSGTDGPAMSTAAAGGDGIATMLLLRRVPLFARLGPEDLHRVALAARERDFAAGHILIAEGEPGDALLVLLSGSVRVLQRTAGGGERLVRTYGEGDHIGELALLRQQPRSASVVADTQVRALIVDGADVAAILRERPEAAMAMLATLAERISEQG